MTRAVLIQIVFFAHALAGGGILTRIPDIQLALGLDEAALGMSMTIGAAGGLASILFSGRVVQRFGTKPIMVAGVSLIALMSLMVALAPNWALLSLAMLLSGMAFSVTNVAMNVEADRVESDTGRKVMNRCHGVWSGGMLIASVIGVGARAIPVAPTLHMLVMLPVLLALSIFVLTRIEPAPRACHDRAQRPGLALPSRHTVLLVLFGLSGPIAQSGTQNWSVIFMRDSYAAPDWVDTLTLPAFLIAMMLGRLPADGWTMRYGPVRVVFAMTLLAIAGGALVVSVPTMTAALTGFVLMGFGTAITFPMMVTAAARDPSRPAAESVSAVILATSVSMLGAPALMGWIAETMGLRAAFGAMIPMMLVTLALCRLLAPARVPAAA